MSREHWRQVVSATLGKRTKLGKQPAWWWSIRLDCGHEIQRARPEGDQVEESIPCPRCKGKSAETSTSRISKAAGFTSGGRRKECRWCEGPIFPPRFSFCSDECVHEHRIRSDQGYARHQVFARDRGICKLCGLDTQRLRSIWTKWRHRPIGPVQPIDADRWKVPGGIRLFQLLGLSYPANRSTLWDMDHETPVIEGGGACGLDNLRTLCLWCHRVETAKLRQRMAAANR